MNFALIFALSLFGMLMGVGTVFFISSSLEPLFWLAIFIVCAYLIATRAPGRPFLHGLMLGIVNSLWVTSAHVLLFGSYVARHPEEAAMIASTPLPTHPRLMMAILGPIIGVVSGIVLGLFAFIASKFIRRPAGRTPATS